MGKRLLLSVLLLSLGTLACGDDSQPTPTPPDTTGGCENLDPEGNCLDDQE